jgi:hypothetical protein
VRELDRRQALITVRGEISRTAPEGLDSDADAAVPAGTPRYDRALPGAGELAVNTGSARPIRKTRV